MDAIILVGGRGTRLRPLTARRHKSLLPLCGRPAFDYLLEWLRGGGIERAVLAIGEHNEDLAAAYPPGDWHGLRIAAVTEHQALQSGGAIRNAVHEARVEGRFAVVNGDVFVAFDLQAMLAAHEESMADLSIALHEEEDARQFGVATLDERCLITRFVEKSPEPPSRLVNAGVWIFESHLVNEIPAGAVRVEETLFPDLVASGRPVLGHRFEGQWADIGTPERYLRLVMELLDGGAAGLAPDVLLGTRARVSRSAAGPGCRLGPRAEVSGSVLWEGVEISPGARVADSILADGVFVGAGVRLEGCVVGSGARIVEGSVVPAGAVIEADAVVGGNNG